MNLQTVKYLGKSKLFSRVCVYKNISLVSPISTTKVKECGVVYQKHKKSHYHKEDKTPILQHVKQGFGMLKGEFNLWKEEMKEDYKLDPKLYQPGDTEIIWKFDSQESLKKWIIVSDKDHEEGFSECNFIINKNGKGLFYGMINTKVPKDGKVERTGFCNIKTERITKSFKRDSYLDWSAFTHLVMRVRGDGRRYMINIGNEGYFDIVWNDIYTYGLFTHGGPYWQTAKIPFSKFFLQSKGRIQDRQVPVCLQSISDFGITCADTYSGPFHLEIDYIGIHFNANHKETFAYELYDIPDGIQN